MNNVLREILPVEILGKRVIKSELSKRTIEGMRVGTNVYNHPRISILVSNPNRDRDIKDIDLIWKLFDSKTGNIVDNNLNHRRIKFSVASEDKYVYKSTTNKKIPSDSEYQMKISATTEGHELIVIDKTNEVQLVGFQ